MQLHPQDKVRLEAAQQMFLNEPEEPWQDCHQVLFRHFSVADPVGTATVMLLQPKLPSNKDDPPDAYLTAVLDRWFRAIDANPPTNTESLSDDDNDAVVLLRWPDFLDLQHPDELEMLRYAFVEAIKLLLDVSYNQSYNGLKLQEVTVATQWCQLLRRLLAKD